MQFTPSEDFFEAGLGSAYVKGLTYTVRPGDDKLRLYVEKWLVEGKITVLDDVMLDAKVTGIGTVT